MPQVIGYDARAQWYAVEHGEVGDEQFLESLVVTTPKRASILEIPAGAGRGVPLLAGSGRRGVLADIEPKMVTRIRSRIRKLGAAGRLSACVADLGALDFGHHFDLIVVPREGFQLLPRTRAVAALSSIARHLAPGGFAVLDLATMVRRPGSSGIDKEWPAYFDGRGKDGTWLCEWTRQLRGGQRLTRWRRHWRRRRSLTLEFRYLLTARSGAQRQYATRIELARYTTDELRQLVSCAGLTVSRSCGDYRGGPARRGAPRLILWLHKIHG